MFEREDGTVVHVTDREVAPGPVRGSIDWARRFDHMQQHSGSHVLTAAFLALFDIPPVSFHMGKSGLHARYRDVFDFGTNSWKTSSVL